MKKTSTVRVNGNMIFKGQKLTIGVDLGDHWSCYCVLDEAGTIILEQKVATTPKAMKQAFAKIPRSLIALETGTHSAWISRLLTELGYTVIVAHAQKVQLISKSNRKDDRHDARTLARLARIDSELLGPMRNRRAQGANPADGNPGASRTGESTNRLGERSARIGGVGSECRRSFGAAGIYPGVLLVAVAGNGLTSLRVTKSENE
jgi:Transposase